LGPADSAHRHVDATFVFVLPDSGGFLVNGQPLPRAAIPDQLQALFGPRAPEMRAVLVWDNPRRRVDAQWISAVARAAGGDAFDAELSGWPRALPAAP